MRGEAVSRTGRIQGRLKIRSESKAVLEGDRLTFPNLFRLASITFVLAVLFRTFFYSPNGAQPNSLLFDFFSYSLAGIGVAIASGGIADMVIHRRYNFGWLAAGKTSASVVVGLALTFLSAPYPPYGVFEISYVGFPLPFTATSYTALSPFTSVNPAAFLIDCTFWIALSHPAVWLAASALSGDLRTAGRLEAVGEAAFLTYGSYPGWEALFSTGVFNSMFGAIGPVSLLVPFFLPSLLVGALLAVRGYRILGYTVFLASLLFISFLGLAILAASLHVVL